MANETSLQELVLVERDTFDHTKRYVFGVFDSEETADATIKKFCDALCEFHPSRHFFKQHVIVNHVL